MNKLIGTALLSTVIGLASCTEEYDLPQQAGFAGERPLAGHVSLNVATPSSEADTRLAYEPGAGYRFEAGDSLAACLMDVVASTDTAASWYERYHLTDVVTESAAFTLDAEGSWTTASTLREGNYFFLYPYKPGQKAGGACTFSLSGQTQTGTSRESLTRAFAENNLYVGYAPIVTDSTREGYGVDVELRPVFGALGIRVYNNARQACHVRSLTLRLPGGGFPTTVAINPTVCGYATKDGTFNIAQYVGDNSPEGVEAGYDVAFTDYSRRKAIRDLVKPLPASEAAETVRLTVEEAEPLKRQASQDFLVMLPEGTYADLLLDIETDEGLIHHLPLSGETVVSTAKGALREVRFTGDDLSPLPEVNASSTLDVEYLIRWNVNTETMQNINPIFVMSLIPVLSIFVYPALNRTRLFKTTPLRRMTVGMALTALSFVICGVLQNAVDAAHAAGTPAISVWWMALPYFVLTAGEVLFSATGLEFAFSQAPATMRSTITSLWNLTTTVGNFLVVLVVALTAHYSAADRFYLFAAMMFAVAAVFGVFAVFYKYKDARVPA